MNDLDEFGPVIYPPRKLSKIEELERLLESEEDVALRIMPNGEIVEVERGEATSKKPLTMRENLGGEYGQHT